MHARLQRGAPVGRAARRAVVVVGARVEEWLVAGGSGQGERALIAPHDTSEQQSTDSGGGTD